jgi:hypothetical protein
MAVDLSSMAEGFFAHLIGGLIGGLVGWFLHAVYHRWERGRHHAEFDREIVDFVTHLKSLISKDHMPGVMERVVPLVSKATFGTEAPPLR